MPSVNIGTAGPDGSWIQALSVSNASSGNTTLISAVAGTVIRVYRALLIAASAGATLQFLDGTSVPLCGLMSPAVGTPIQWPFDGNSWFATSVGNAFTISCGNTTLISGNLYFTQRGTGISSI